MSATTADPGPHGQHHEIVSDEPKLVVVGLGKRRREIRPFRQKAITGVHRLGAARQTGLDDSIDAQIALDRGGGTNCDRLIGEAEKAQADPLAAAVKSADALHNCQTMVADLHALGEPVWQRFHGSPSEQLWYYQTLAAVLRRRLSGHPINDELDEAVSHLATYYGQRTAKATESGD